MSAPDHASPELRSPARTTSARALPWVARIAWLTVAVIGGSAIDAAAADRSAAVRWVIAIGGWSAFACVALALLIPSVMSLTVSRIGVPLAVGATVAAAVGGASAANVGALGVSALVAVTATFSAEVGRWMVQASAYGDEHRLPLRAPSATGAAAALSWMIWATASVSGPLLIAAQNLALGIPVTIVAVVATVYFGPRWHRMARRWLVLVPAGLVVHDPVVLADTLMVRSEQIAGISLARDDTGAADLTGPATGHALEVNTTASVSTVFAFTPSEPDGKAIHMTAFLVAPSRPGEALQLAAARHFPIA